MRKEVADTETPTETSPQGKHGGEAAPDIAARVAAAKAELQADQRALQRIRMQMTQLTERRWHDLFSTVETILRRCYSDRRVLADAEAYRILERLQLCGDLDTFHSHLEDLATRLSQLAGMSGVSRGFEPGRQASMAEGEKGAGLSLSGRMHLRL